MINGEEEALPQVTKVGKNPDLSAEELLNLGFLNGQQPSASVAIHIWISGPVVLVLSWNLYNGPQCRDGRVNSYDNSMKTSAKTCEQPVATK